MKALKKNLWTILLALLLSGCAAMSRGCTSFWAWGAGADWVVVQFAMDCKVFNCWKLHDASIANESQSDGIQWKDTRTGHMVHISGWYNRVQVTGSDYKEAAKLIGVEENKCGSGKYPAES